MKTHVNRLLTSLGVAATAVLCASSAYAAPNDISLQRFGSCTFVGDACVGTTTNEAGFRALARDLGLVFAPKGLVSAETLGQAGFAFQIDHNFSIVNANDEHWILASPNSDPSSTLSTTQFHVRKGLPFSFELGGSFTPMWDSNMMAIGAELRWSLHEDYLWPVPDVGIRAFGSTVVGSPQLNLTVAGVDVLASLPIGVGSIVNITPFIGYQMAIVVSASRLIDATPDDPTPPFTSSNPAESNAPEFVFGVDNEVTHAGLGGIRFQVAVFNLTTQVTASSHVQTYSISAGLDF